MTEVTLFGAISFGGSRAIPVFSTLENTPTYYLGEEGFKLKECYDISQLELIDLETFKKIELDHKKDYLIKLDLPFINYDNHIIASGTDYHEILYHNFFLSIFIKQPSKHLIVSISHEKISAQEAYYAFDLLESC